MGIALVWPRYVFRNFSTPLGVLYIASALKSNNYAFDFIDGTITSIEETNKMLADKKPELLMISLFTAFADSAFEVIKAYRKAVPDGKVIAGGPHATIFPRETLENGVDIVVIGEGEKTIIEIMKNPDRLGEIDGVGYRKDGNIIINEKKHYIHDLDNVLFPDRTLLSRDYFTSGSMGMITSRGCPFSCAFCQPTLRRLFGVAVRRRSVRNVMEEIENTRKVYGVNQVRFTDDGLTYDKEWLVELCNSFLEKNMGITWTASSRADTMPDMETLKLMKRAGCTKISIGVESGDDRIRNEILRKGVSREKIISAFRDVHAAGMKGLAFLMVGSPTETMESVRNTIRILEDARPDEAQVTLTSPLPKTFLYDYCKERNIIETEKWKDYVYSYESHLKLENFSKSGIEAVHDALQYTIFMRSAVLKAVKFDIGFSGPFMVLGNPLIRRMIRLVNKSPARKYIKKLYYSLS
ncbi:MAG: radical SAM protein [Candidatus Aenigmatarchaeota archaeon]